MNLSELRDAFIESFIQLSSDPLNEIDDQATYSFNYKHEFIFSLEELFKEYKRKGISQLKVKMSRCNHCFPDTPAYSFYNSDTDEFVVRYIIYQESSTSFRVEECKNKTSNKNIGRQPF